MIAAVLGTLSFVFQNICCKEYGRRFPNTLHPQLTMIVVSMSLVTAIMAALGGAQLLAPVGYLLTLAFGLFFVLTLATMTLAMNCGHMGVTLLIQNSSLLIPTLFGMIAWGERLTLVKGVGVALILALLALSAGDTPPANDEQFNTPRARRRWIALTLLAFFGDGALGILQGLMSRACADVGSVAFTFWTSLFSVIAAAALILFYRARGVRADYITPKTRGHFLLWSCGIGLGTAGGNCLSILALVSLPGVVFFPLRQGSVVLLMWLAGVVLYKEKINRRGIWMLLCGLAGLVLLNLGG